MYAAPKIYSDALSCQLQHSCTKNHIWKALIAVGNDLETWKWLKVIRIASGICVLTWFRPKRWATIMTAFNVVYGNVRRLAHAKYYVSHYGNQTISSTPPGLSTLVAWLSGRTSVFGRRTFPVLRSTCSWRVTTYVGKPSAMGQPTRPTQPFIPSGSIDE